jgi:Bacterial PH domain
VYAFRGSPLLRCLLSPLIDPIVGIGYFALGIFVALAVAHLSVGAGWIVFACWFVIFETRCYRARVEADGSGITLTNVLRTYRIPWGEVEAIRVRPGSRSGSEKIAIASRNPSWPDRAAGLDPITAYASVGMSLQKKQAAVSSLIAVASQHGFSVREGI